MVIVCFNYIVYSFIIHFNTFIDKRTKNAKNCLYFCWAFHYSLFCISSKTVKMQRIISSAAKTASKSAIKKYRLKERL